MEDNKICLNCGAALLRKKTTKYCTARCRVLYHNRVNIEKTPLVGIGTASVGAIAEYMVCIDLLKKGFDVFKSISPASNCDILALKEGRVLKLEVRTARYYKMSNGGIKLSYPLQRLEGKFLVLVTHSDGKIHYISESV